jgi:hypothetical protein
MKQQPPKKMAAYFMPVANKHSGNRVGKWKHPQRQTTNLVWALTARSAAFFICQNKNEYETRFKFKP